MAFFDTAAHRVKLRILCHSKFYGVLDAFDKLSLTLHSTVQNRKRRRFTRTSEGSAVVPQAVRKAQLFVSKAIDKRLRDQQAQQRKEEKNIVTTRILFLGVGNGT